MASIIGAIWQAVVPGDEHTTPKATPAPEIALPTFSLDEDAKSAGNDDSEPKASVKIPTQKASGLMPPPKGPALPLPNRGPPANSQQRAGSNGRGKVLLAPGHSPMDWASLTRTKNLSGVPSFQRVTPSQMKKMNGRKGNPIWSSYQGKVYNITPYLPFHPGGEKELMKSAGRDGTKLFMEVHPWVNWEGMLSACLVGILVSEDAESELDGID